MFECLKDIVGISAGACSCLTNTLPPDDVAALTASKSGLFTDDLPGGIALKSLKGIDDCKNLARLALDARDEAIKIATDDLIVLLNGKYAKNKNVFTGNIGATTASQVLVMGKRYGGLRLRPVDVSDGVITLTGGTLVLNTAATVNIAVIRAFSGADTGIEIANIPVTTAGPNLAAVFTISQPLKMPLKFQGKAVEYFIVYDRTVGGGVLPKNNKVSCGCGSIEKNLLSFINTDGVELDNLELLSGRVLDNFAHGITLNVDVRCNNENFVCREFDENDAVSITLAHAVRFKTGELIIEKALSSGQVNRFTLMDRETLWGKRNRFRAEYESRIKYLEDAINIESTDCFICKDDALYYSGILA